MNQLSYIQELADSQIPRVKEEIYSDVFLAYDETKALMEAQVNVLGFSRVDQYESWLKNNTIQVKGKHFTWLKLKTTN